MNKAAEVLGLGNLRGAQSRGIAVTYDVVICRAYARCAISCSRHKAASRRTTPSYSP